MRCKACGGYIEQVLATVSGHRVYQCPNRVKFPYVPGKLHDVGLYPCNHVQDESGAPVTSAIYWSNGRLNVMSVAADGSMVSRELKA